jgi:hypothetical protein
MAQSIPQHLLPLVSQKSEYPYELNDLDRFSRTKLPTRKEFNTILSGLNYCKQGCRKCIHEIKGKKCNRNCKCKKEDCEHKKCKEEDIKEIDDCEHEKIYTISQKQYDHAQTVWEKAECKTFGDYHDLYLRTDIVILADSIQKFRITMKEVSGLDLLNYITLSSFAFDMALKLTKVKLELFHKGQEEIHELVQCWLRGGNSMAPHHLVKANFPGMKGYNKWKLKKWLLYSDANNLYG